MSDTENTEEHTAGNTNIRSRGWCFTLNNYTETDAAHLTHIWASPDIRYAFQEETAPTTGTPHFQGIVYFKNARCFNAMKALDRRIRWSAMIDQRASVIYCTKNATRTGRIYVHGFDTPWVIEDPMQGLVWKVWQNAVRNIIQQEPHPRKVYWLWDRTGGIGKTTLAKHLCLLHGAIYVNGAASHVKYAIAEMAIKPRIVIFDYPRVSEQYVSYSSIEEAKNGIFFSGKYKSGMVLFNTPHVIIFANFEPNRNMLSADRWVVVEISGLLLENADIGEHVMIGESDTEIEDLSVD